MDINITKWIPGLDSGGKITPTSTNITDVGAKKMG